MAEMTEYASAIDEALRLIDKGDIASALTPLERAFGMRPDNADTCHVLANCYRSLGNVPRSEEFFQKALALRPQHPDTLYGYAVLLRSAGRVSEAIDLLNRCVALQPGNVQYLNDLGVLCHEKHDEEKAVGYFRQAMDSNPGYLVPKINLGHLYLSAGRTGDAAAILAGLSLEDRRDPDAIDLAAKLKQGRAHKLASVAPRSELLFSGKTFQIAPLEILKQFGQNEPARSPGLSVVIPIYNELENVPKLYNELSGVLKHLEQEYEIVFIDDGSMDGSRSVLEEIASIDHRVKLILFRRNYGQTAALCAGFKYAQGDVVITLDGDLQNDPADIPKLLSKMAEGYDLVNGWRKNRQDKMVSRKIPSLIANRIINKLIEGTGVQLRDFGCTLKAYKKGIVKNINLYGEMHRFIPVFAAWLGVRVAEIPVNHRPRMHGKAKYNLSRVSRVVFDLIVVRFFSDYMTRPIQFFGKITKKLVGYGMLFLIALTGVAFFTNIGITINTILILFALLFFGSLQILFLGLLGEILIRSYFEGQKKDYFVVEKIVNDTTGI